MVTGSEEFALCNPLIVSKIFTFLGGEDLLKCREINSLWNAEVEKAWKKRENLYLNVRRFWDKVNPRVVGDPRFYYPLPPSFFSSRLNVENVCEFFSLKGIQKPEVEVVRLSGEKDARPEYRAHLYKIPFPCLRKLILRGKYDSMSSIFEPFSIPTLKVLEVEIEKYYYPEPNVVQDILNGTPNLEELKISSQYQFFPQAFPKHLKKLCFSFTYSTSIPELESVLNQLSNQLEALNLDLTVQSCGDISPKIRFPVMRKLKALASSDLYCFPTDESFIGFLQNRMPSLENLQIKTPRRTFHFAYIDNEIMNAINCSNGVHAFLSVLSIPQPCDDWKGESGMEMLTQKFPKLKKFSFTNEKRKGNYYNYSQRPLL